MHSYADSVSYAERFADSDGVAEPERITLAVAFTDAQSHAIPHSNTERVADCDGVAEPERVTLAVAFADAQSHVIPHSNTERFADSDGVAISESLDVGNAFCDAVPITDPVPVPDHFTNSDGVPHANNIEDRDIDCHCVDNHEQDAECEPVAQPLCDANTHTDTECDTFVVRDGVCHRLPVADCDDELYSDPHAHDKSDFDPQQLSDSLAEQLS